MFVNEFFHGLTSYIIFGYYNFIASSVYGLPKPKRGKNGGFFSLPFFTFENMYLLAGVSLLSINDL